jgi:hypothetical protein
MASNVTRDHHLLTRNLKLNGNYISNDGDNEGISIADDGDVTISSTDTQLKIVHNANDYATLAVADTGDLTIATVGDGSTDSDMLLNPDGDLNLKPATSAINCYSGSYNTITLDTNGVMGDGGAIRLASILDDGDYCEIDTRSKGVTTIRTVDDDGAAAHLDIVSDGNCTINAEGEIILDSVSGGVGIVKFYDGGTTQNYFQISTIGQTGETTLSTVDVAEDAAHLNIEPDGHVEFDGCGVGFDLVTPTYDATDTNVDFRLGNKQFLTFGSGNIATVNFYFPATSGNFVCLIKQDGTGSRVISSAAKAFDSAGNAAAGSSTVKFVGGNAPSLTTDANHVDILSFFWDADNEIAYCVPSMDFQF